MAYHVHEYGNGVSLFTLSATRPRVSRRLESSGSRNGRPVPMACHSFGGWKALLFGVPISIAMKASLYPLQSICSAGRSPSTRSRVHDACRELIHNSRTGDRTLESPKIHTSLGAARRFVLANTADKDPDVFRCCSGKQSRTIPVIPSPVGSCTHREPTHRLAGRTEADAA